MILGWPGARNSVMVPGGEIKAGSNAFSSTQLTRLSRPRLFQRFAARVARGGFGLREHSLYTRIEAREMVSNPKRILERKRGARHYSLGWHRPSVLAAAIKSGKRTYGLLRHIRSMSKFFWPMKINGFTVIELIVTIHSIACPNWQVLDTFRV